jgi:polar amino acid transport system ATP-binding protein
LGSTVNGLLNIQALRLAYRGRPILANVGLTVSAGEVCALLGLSGAGKTSVLRSIAALQPFDGGSITVDGFTLHPGPTPPQSRLQPLRRKVGMVFQQHALFEHLSALANVTLALEHVARSDGAAAEQRAVQLLDSLGVGARAQAYPSELSGGEAQRVAIARALALDPHLLLMDEPTAALDPARRDALGRTLRRLAADGRGLLVATHDVPLARGYAESGPPAKVLDHPEHEATRRLLQNGDPDR